MRIFCATECKLIGFQKTFVCRRDRFEFLTVIFSFLTLKKHIFILFFKFLGLVIVYLKEPPFSLEFSALLSIWNRERGLVNPFTPKI